MITLRDAENFLVCYKSYYKFIKALGEQMPEMSLADLFWVAGADFISEGFTWNRTAEKWEYWYNLEKAWFMYIEFLEREEA